MEHFFELVNIRFPSLFLIWTPVQIWIFCKIYTWHQAFVIFPVKGIGTRNGHRSQGTAMERIPECNDSRTFCVMLCQLDRSFVCLSTTVAEIYHGVPSGKFHQTLCQSDIAFIINNIMSTVNHLIHLFFGCLHNLWVIMANVAHCNTTCKIKVFFSILRCQITALCTYNAQLC